MKTCPQENIKRATDSNFISTLVKDICKTYEDGRGVNHIDGHNLPRETEIVLYRIVQEALTNIARYAHVTQAKVRVWIEQENLGIMVEDEGVGFDPNAVTPGAQSSGLIGMRERALLLGGQFVLESVPGHGTRINAKLPLQAFVERRTRERVL